MAEKRRQWRKPEGLRLCAQALRERVASPVQWVMAQAIWNGSPPAERTVQKWFQALDSANIDLMALHGPTPPTRMTLTQRREAQHLRLAEHIQRYVFEFRELEQRHAADVAEREECEDPEAADVRQDVAVLTAGYHAALVALSRPYIDVEREYRMGLTGLTVDDLSDRDLRSEVVGTFIASADEFDEGEAERIIAALQSVGTDSDDGTEVL